jgi:hypothetical protein
LLIAGVTDDLHFDAMAVAKVPGTRTRVATVGVENLEAGNLGHGEIHRGHGSIAILDVPGGDQDSQQEPQRVGDQMTLALL